MKSLLPANILRDLPTTPQSRRQVATERVSYQLQLGIEKDDTASPDTNETSPTQPATPTTPTRAGT